MPKIRLDEYLIDLGHFDSIASARGWIMSGRIVVDGSVVSKPGVPVAGTAKITVRGRRLQYASKGGYKLRHALTRFGVCVSGRACLDAGASTGGFTDCLLQAGASFVHSVEVGFGQLRGELAQDARVRSLERTNISDVSRTGLEPSISLAVADLSYLSLRKSIPIIKSLFVAHPEKIVFLVKPLYEGLKQTDMQNLAEIEHVLSDVLHALLAQEICVTKLCVSPILGGRGAIEFFGYVDGESQQKIDQQKLVRQAIDEAEKSRPCSIEQYLREINFTRKL